MITNKKFFDAWAQDYDNYLPKIPQYRSLIKLIVKKIKVAYNSKILDVGIGTGYLAFSVLKKKTCKMFGIDISTEMLKKAKHKAAKLGFKIVLKKGNAKNLNFTKNYFDATVSAYALHHLQDSNKIKCLRKIYNSLKKGGKFVNGDMFVKNEPLGLKRLKEVTNKWMYKSNIASKYADNKAAKLELDHISLVYFKEGEYIIPIEKWEKFMRKVGFKKIGYKIVNAITGDFVIWGEK